MKFLTVRVISFGFFGRLFNRSAYSKALDIAREKQSVLRRLVKRSPEHKAALRRIVSAMLTDNDGREAPNRTGDVKGMSEAGYADSEIDKGFEYADSIGWTDKDDLGRLALSRMLYSDSQLNSGALEGCWESVDWSG